jgi:hypothetical protein
VGTDKKKKADFIVSSGVWFLVDQSDQRNNQNDN